jgi:hypothetical protein
VNAKNAFIVLLVLIFALIVLISLDSQQSPTGDVTRKVTSVAPSDTPSQSASFIVLLLQSSCRSERANVTYTDGSSTEQKTVYAPAIVKMYVQQTSQDFFDISAQDDSETDDEGNPISDCVDVHVSIWNLAATPGVEGDLAALAHRPMRKRVDYVTTHGALLNQAQSTERFGIADASWNPQR